MKLLLDANLSWRLIRKLLPEFPESIHVSETGLTQPATDVAIWDYADKYGYVIVTNDEDYLRLSLSKGFPPKVVLLKTGNQSSNFIYELLFAKKTAIEALSDSELIGVIELY